MADYMNMRADTIAPVAKGLDARSRRAARLGGRRRPTSDDHRGRQGHVRAARTTILVVLVLGLLAAIGLGLLVARHGRSGR